MEDDEKPTARGKARKPYHERNAGHQSHSRSYAFHLLMFSPTAMHWRSERKHRERLWKRQVKRDKPYRDSRQPIIPKACKRGLKKIKQNTKAIFVQKDDTGGDMNKMCVRVCAHSSAAETKPFTITATQGLPKKQCFTLHRGECWANCRRQKLWFTDKQHWGCSYNLPLSPTQKISQLWWALTEV